MKWTIRVMGRGLQHPFLLWKVLTGEHYLLVGPTAENANAIYSHYEAMTYQAVYPLFERAARGQIVLLLHPLTLAELIWTLERFYGYRKEEIRRSLSDSD